MTFWRKSTEINSNQNEAIPVSPRSTAQVERRNGSFLRNLWKAGARVRLGEEEEEKKKEVESSDSENDEQDNKVSRKKKNRPHRQ